MSPAPIAIASDHGGFEMKSALKAELVRLGHEVLDLGTHDTESVDYPDLANLMADAIKQGKAQRGILACGTGIGISIAANRHPHLRAALVHDGFTARMARQHNDANILVLGGRTMGIEVAKDCLAIFLSTEFEGGRHARRVNKLAAPGSSDAVRAKE
jgi:ribose 5-phosphate isomerase B